MSTIMPERLNTLFPSIAKLKN